jgi:ADP-heptose:LPS heptosyltransferase/SAM-dependent methyltransferase
MRSLILRSFQSPGDILMLTAAVRDLHAAAPGEFRTDVRTSANVLWLNNPHLTALREGEAGVEVIDMHYPLIHQSNQRPYHFLHGYAQFLEQRLGRTIPVTHFHGDLHLSAEEKAAPPLQGLPERFWIVVAGGKYDFTAKWWDPEAFQKVVDRFRGRLSFVQCGEAGHWHPRLQGVTDLVGKTSLRDFVRLMHFADGVLCPVTFAMHLAAAVETRPGRPRLRPCVVVAGGREPPHWEAYPGHQFLHTIGMLSCCAEGGCWRSRCQTAGDGDDKDRTNLCLKPVQVQPELRIPLCMNAISAADVIRRIEMYVEGEATPPPGPLPETERGRKTEVEEKSGSRSDPPTTGPLPEAEERGRKTEDRRTADAQPLSAETEARKVVPERLAGRRLLLEFRHSLGDAVQLTVVLRHLKHYHPNWRIEVAALPGKHSAFAGLCERVLIVDRDRVDQADHDEVFRLSWEECRTGYPHWPSSKPSRCLTEVFRLSPLPELCRYHIRIGDQAREAAHAYLSSLGLTPRAETGRFPVLLLHYQGNTSGERKDLPHDLARDVCQTALAAGYVPVVLDWDRRSPLPDGVRIHNPGADHELWGGLGTGDAEVLAALIQEASLFVGVDSGPLHVAGATDTPAIAVWTRHHPVHFYDLAANVTHLVPADHAGMAIGAAGDFFAQSYRHRVYRQLYVELPALVQSLLTGEDIEQLANRRFLGQLSATAFDQRYYEEHRLAGLDYLAFGDWQRQYGRWLVECLGWQGQRVLEVGCACGAVLRGLGEAGAVVQGVDVNEHMIRLGRQHWPDMEHLLLVCDAVNLHLFEEASWDGLHSAQVAEHWRPELVPFILRELARVTRPGGLFFCCLDTEELFARQGRSLESEDPTHVCIRPLGWWHEQLKEAGWQVCTAEFEGRLRGHRDSFLKRYDWDWFVARRDPSSQPPPRGGEGEEDRREETPPPSPIGVN